MARTRSSGGCERHLSAPDALRPVSARPQGPHEHGGRPRGPGAVCDHRLVDYVFNIPWRLKTFDGREKSILRAATRELLPDSIVERQKSPYPSTQDPAYEKALRANVAEVLEERSHPATPLLNRKVIEDMLARPVGNVSSLPDRSGLERALSISTWVKRLRRRGGPVIVILVGELDPEPGSSRRRSGGFAYRLTTAAPRQRDRPSSRLWRREASRRLRWCRARSGAPSPR